MNIHETQLFRGFSSKPPVLELSQGVWDSDLEIMIHL